MLLAACGEQKGLLGSSYYARPPTVGKRKIVANSNTDRYLPLHKLERWIVYSLDESSLAAPVRAAAKEFAVELQPDPQPNRNIFARSDKQTFIHQGVPTLRATSSLRAGSLPAPGPVAF